MQSLTASQMALAFGLPLPPIVYPPLEKREPPKVSGSLLDVLRRRQRAGGLVAPIGAFQRNRESETARVALK